MILLLKMLRWFITKQQRLWRRCILWLIQIFEPYLYFIFRRLHNIHKMIACMTYEGTLGELEDFPVSEEPVWILGKQYSTETELEILRADVRSRLWLTYRRNFPEIGNSGFTSDKGWGCMLRCGQMVLAEASIRHHLGRLWQWDESIKDEAYLKTVRLFEDYNESPFSVIKISQLGVDEGKPIGEWYGPNTVAQVLKKLTPSDTWNNFVINVALDNILILDEIRNSCYGNSDHNWRPLLLFIPLRLGVTEINPIYIPGIKKCLQMPQSLGLIGGKPNHASYFIGFMGEEIVYLDPHTTQDAVSVGSKETETEIEADLTYHTTAAQRMPFDQLDPSLAVCFLCGNEKDFDDLCNRLRHGLVDMEKTAIIELYPTRPDFLKEDYWLEGAIGVELEDHHLDSDDEEFEVLE